MVVPQDPQPEDWTGITLGAFVKHYTYDALGRLVRTQSPYPDPDLAGGVRHTERFYYDGIRRIQEVFIDPVAAASMVDGDPELTLLAAASIGPELYEIDGLSAPAAFEAAQTGDDQEDPEPDPGPGNPGGPSPTVNTWLDREYVWGPGDRGVDELLIQFNPSRAAMPVLQDAGGDCIALCDFGGTGGAARVVAQFTYDPYGQVITHEHLVPQHAFLRAGHKGLFVDRLDVGVLTSGDETPRLAAGANLLGHNRNRTLKPDLGRFLQVDPNASALVVASSSYGGTASNAAVSGFDLDMLYGDGANLYEYLGSGPWDRSDPMGLSWDPFAWHVDSYLAEDAGSKAAFLGRIASSSHVAAYLGAYFAAWSGIPGLADAGELGMWAMGEPEGLRFNDWWSNLRMGEQEAAAFLGLVSDMKMVALETSAHYAMQFGRRSLSTISPDGLVDQGMQIAGVGGLWGIFSSPAVLPGQTSVYVGYARDTERLAYVGTTDDLERRGREWRKKYRLERVGGKMMTLQALAVETALIEEARARGYSLDNRRRSIGLRRPGLGMGFGLAMSWAREYIRRTGINIF